MALDARTILAKIFREKIKTYGLGIPSTKKLKLKAVAASVASELGPGIAARGGFVIPYFDLRGKPDGFFRFRYLEALAGFPSKAGARRYAQVTGTPPRAYLPPLMPWAKISKDPTLPVVITEGEMKAACACVRRIPTIGLGGVDAWRSSKLGWRLLPELEAFDWKDRRTYIAFDSDIRTKPDVRRAFGALATELTSRGALVFDVDLTDTKNEKEKFGLDDFIVRFGVPALRERLENASPFVLAAELHAMNQEFAVLHDSASIIELTTGNRWGAKTFTDAVVTNRTYPESVTLNGVTKINVKPLGKAWLAWPQRLVLKGTTYAPGEGVISEDGKYNLWRGWGVEPKRGDTKLWRELLKFLFAGHADYAARIKWFEQWCAYPLQHPGTKLYTGVLVWGTEQGTGKSLVGYTLGSIYGGNFSEIGPTDLHDRYNDWRAGKQLVFGDEIKGGDKRADGDYLKRLITSKEIRVSQKYVAGYVVPDAANYFFTSNHPDPLHMDAGDRRFFVNEVRGKPLPESFYQSYDTWLKGDGPAFLFERLLTLDLTGFDPRGASPFTYDKSEMADMGQTDVEGWASQLVQSPRVVLGDVFTDSDLWTAAQLAEIYNAGRVSRISVNAMARALVGAGAPRVGGSQFLTHTPSRGILRLHAIRNAKKWRDTREPKKLAAHYEKFFGSLFKRLSKLGPTS